MKAILTITITYAADDAPPSAAHVKATLEEAAQHLVDNGLLTGEQEGSLDSWSAAVTVEEETAEDKATDTATERYIRSGGAFCLSCNSDNLQGGDRETNDGVMTQFVECLNCGKTWTDIYTLSGVSEQ